MELDENVCLCFHVTRRKLESFLRVERPTRSSQLSECGGAGTGCGWCVRILEKMFECHNVATLDEIELPTASEYAENRKHYIAEK